MDAAISTKIDLAGRTSALRRVALSATVCVLVPLAFWSGLAAALFWVWGAAIPMREIGIGVALACCVLVPVWASLCLIAKR